MADEKHEHTWTKGGLWDGKDPHSGKRTGGVTYKCTGCEEKAYSMEEVKEKGGSYDDNTNVMGKPKGEYEGVK